MNRKFWLILMLAIPLALGMIGCSDDDDGNNDDTVGPGDSDAVTYTLDATSTTDFAYFSFSAGEEITVTDPASDSNWDMAFRRYEVKLNGGASGSAGVGALDLGDVSFDDLTAIPDSVTADHYAVDAVSYVVEGWYGYNPETHQTPATLRPFVLKTNEGEYVKFRILEVVPSGMNALGTLAVEYEVAASGSFSGVNDTIAVTENEGADIFIDFSAGSTIADTDKDTDTNWDLLFDGYTAMVNGGVSGPGSCGVYPIYEEESDYGSIADVPADMGASYPADSFDSAMSSWWSYDGQNHTVNATNRIYLVNTGDLVYKVQILGYYEPDSGDAAHITFQYEELLLFQFFTMRNSSGSLSLATRKRITTNKIKRCCSTFAK
jgi:hypothetical protein